MAGSRRNGIVIAKTGAQLTIGTGFAVNVLPPGGIATNVPTGTTIPLQVGHGFTVGAKILVYTVASKAYTYYGTATVASKTASSITMTAGTYVVVAGDIIFNVGADTSTGSNPNWNGNGTAIYTDLELTSAISNQKVFNDTDGEYTFCWLGSRVWEIVRLVSSGAIVGHELDVMGSATSLNGTALPASGDYPGQNFYLRSAGGVGGKEYFWAEDSSGVFHWEEKIGVA